MALILFPGTDQYSAITVSGLYDNNTESPLFAPNGGTVPTSGILTGASDPNGLFQPILVDQSGSVLNFPGIQFKPGTAWTSATSAGTFQYNNGTITEGPKTGAPAYIVQLDQTSTITGGAVTFEGTYDNINWTPIPVGQVLNPNTFAQLTNPYTFVANTNAPFLILSQGYANIRAELTTPITGTGSVTPYWSTLAYEPSIFSTTSATVQGNLTNNNAPPNAFNLGVLPAIAETAYATITYTTGNQVLPVTDLHGALNQDLQAVAGVALGATAVVAFGSTPAAVNVPAVNSSIFSGTTSLTNTAGALNVNVSNTVPVTITGQPITVKGEYTNNTTATSTITDQFAVLPATAATAYATNTWTNGNQVVLVTDLHGAINNDMQAVAGVAIGPTSVVNFGSTPAAAPVQAVNSSIFAGTTALTATGSSLNVNVTNTVPVTISGQPITVKGEYTNNTTATSTITDQFAVLPAIAATAYGTFTWTNGNQVVLVTDLHGAINNDMQASAGVQLGATAVTAFGTAPAAANVIGANVSLFAGTTGLTATGSSLNVNVTNTVTAAGNKTNNNAVPGADNFGALIAITNSGAFPTVTLPTYTAGFEELLRVSQGGSLVTIPADEEYAQSILYFADDNAQGVSPALTTLANATIVPLISIQSNSAAFSFLIREVEAYGDGSQVKVMLIKNPQTLTGAAFTVTGIPTGSHIKRDVTATAVTIGTGTVVWSAMIASASAKNEMLQQWLLFGTPGDTYTLAAVKFGTGTAKAFGSIRWSEEAAAI